MAVAALATPPPTTPISRLIAEATTKNDFFRMMTGLRLA
jgi:hypothetical protein